jgi:hypothetical protein
VDCVARSPDLEVWGKSGELSSPMISSFSTSTFWPLDKPSVEELASLDPICFSP